MILRMAGVLSSDELSKMQNQLAKAEFIDGKLTAGWHAKQVKNNQQIRSHSPVAIKLAGTIMRALQQNALFQISARPKVTRQHREILFDLDTARRSLFKQQGKTAEFDLLTKSMANLMRMWMEV